MQGVFNPPAKLVLFPNSLTALGAAAISVPRLPLVYLVPNVLVRVVVRVKFGCYLGELS